MTSRLKRYLFTLAIPLAAGVLAGLWMLDWRGADSGRPTYDTVEATRGSIRKVVSTTGPVRSLVTVRVGSQLSGQIESVSADYNTEVEEGDVLAVLDAKTFNARVAQAKADLAAAKAQLANQRAALVKSEAVLRQAERAIDRQQKLADRGVAAQAALDTATRDADVARAEIVIANAQIDSAQAGIAQRQAQLDQAMIDLERTTIRSPIKGTVISRTVDVGQTVAASFQAPELFQIAQDLRRIRIEAQVNEADVGVIEEGNQATFSVDAYPERSFEGRVTQVRLAATELQNVVTYTVIIEAANADRRLFPGMTANVQIVTVEKHDILRVPNDALRFRPRDRVAAPRTPTSGAERGARLLERLKGELQLTDTQAAALAEELRKGAGGARDGSSASWPFGGGGAQQQRQDQDGGPRLSARVEQVLSPLLTAEQRPLLERWKREREASRRGTVWVLGSGGSLEERSLRLGISDDQFSEVLGGGLVPGERVVTRVHEVRK